MNRPKETILQEAKAGRSLGENNNSSVELAKLEALLDIRDHLLSLKLIANRK